MSARFSPYWIDSTGTEMCEPQLDGPQATYNTVNGDFACDSIPSPPGQPGHPPVGATAAISTRTPTVGGDRMARPAPANPGTRRPQQRQTRRPQQGQTRRQEKGVCTKPFWDYDPEHDENYQALRALGREVTGSNITNWQVAQVLADFSSQNGFPHATTSDLESLADLALEREWKRSAGTTAHWVKDNWDSHGEEITEFAPESFKKFALQKEKRKKEAASHDSTKQSTPSDSDQHQWDNPLDHVAIFDLDLDFDSDFDFNDGTCDCNDEAEAGFDYHFNTGTGFYLNHPSDLDSHW